MKFRKKILQRVRICKNQEYSEEMKTFLKYKEEKKENMEAFSSLFSYLQPSLIAYIVPSEYFKFATDTP